MFDGDWKVSSKLLLRLFSRTTLTLACMFQENSLNEVDLEEDDPAAIEGMLRYIYGLDHNTECEEGSMEQARFNADLYAVADKYGLSLLREHALSEFTYYVGHYCDYDNGADVVRLLYAPTAISNPKLINILCHNIDKNIDCLIGDKYFIETFKEFPGFSSHYAEYVAINRRGGI